jgi:uncharacterized protein (UPF0548 family)
MFRLSKPHEASLQRIRAACACLPLSYAEVGCSRGPAPAGYVLDHYRVRLGNGQGAFAQARQMFRSWRMLRLGWVEPCWPEAVIKPGELIGTLTRLFGVWAVNVCRIVDVIDEDGPVMRYGLAYGTLPGHAERGEEQFLTEWCKADDSVWYDIRAVSRPGRWLTRLGYPLARRMQRRFGRDSLRAMAEAVMPNQLQSFQSPDHKCCFKSG